MSKGNLINSMLKHPSFSAEQINTVIKLLESGSTIPFIARYRKEATNGLDEVDIAEIQDMWKKYTELTKRKKVILKSLVEQGVLDPTLENLIAQCNDIQTLEDLYLPFKPKRKTRASVAREKGLEPLALFIYKKGHGNLELEAARYLNGDVEEALVGARDIIAEWINEHAQTRADLRHFFLKKAIIRSKVVKDKELTGAKYADYFQFEELMQKCPSHRYLAINRAVEEGVLRLKIEPEVEVAIRILENIHIRHQNPACVIQLELAIEDAYKRLLQPSLETEMKQVIKEKSDKAAIAVFNQNLSQLLLAAPLGSMRVLAIDPGFRTGCKVVVLDELGDFQAHMTIYPHLPQSQTTEAGNMILDWVNKYDIKAIAIGNGTAGKETLQFCTSLNLADEIKIFMVNEAGASIYSASPIARAEFPDLDITIRGALSIGRRLMDPLAELVKIDPKSIGVGQYQHDVNQALLKDALEQTVVYCVNKVGVNLNTASKYLLAFVSGLGPALANSIVDYRTKNGMFLSRSQLSNVPRLGEKAYEQAAGFLRITDAENPLDNTGIHPERYTLVRQMAKDLGVALNELIRNKKLIDQIPLAKYVSSEVGLPTLKDIADELTKPGLDIRGTAQTFHYNQGIDQLEDVRTGMILNGLVTNITKFGAFIDIGVKQDGMVHISQICKRFISDPAEILTLGQEVKVKVLEVDPIRKRIQFSMKDI
jgi:protein Tex